jgi:heat shock protein HslJ
MGCATALLANGPRAAGQGWSRPSVMAAVLAIGLLPQPAWAQGAGLEVQGAWRIEQARTEPLYDRRQARLDFAADGRLTGHTSCAPLQAAYSLDGDRLHLGAVSAPTPARGACTALQLEQEDRVLTALETAHTARVRPDGLLELRDRDGRGVLRATRLPAAP